MVRGDKNLNEYKMKKSILELGARLSKQEQQRIHGGHTCDPQYSQAECDEYCGSLSLAMSHQISIGETETAEIALCGLLDNCGWIFTGDRDEVCEPLGFQ